MERSSTYHLDASKGPLALIGDDSSELDRYAVLAGKLLADGVAASETVADCVLNRLAERATSLFNTREYAYALGMQPRREVAREWLAEVVADSHRPLQTRCGAVIGLARAFGLRLALDAATPLLTETGPAQVFIIDFEVLSAPVSDRRVVVARELAVLGTPVRELVLALVRDARLAADDRIGPLVAAEAAVTAGFPDVASQALACGPSTMDKARVVSLYLRAEAPEREDPSVLADVLIEVGAKPRQSHFFVVKQGIRSSRANGHDALGGSAGTRCARSSPSVRMIAERCL